jgi:hypothetical protein
MDTFRTPEICLESKRYPATTPRPWTKNDDQLNIEFTDLTQSIARPYIHQDHTSPMCVLLALLYQMRAWTAESLG